MGTATEIETECIHGMNPEWCAMCKPPAKPKGRTFRELLDAGDYTVLTRYELRFGSHKWLESVRFPGGKTTWVAYGNERTLWKTKRAAQNHLGLELQNELHEMAVGGAS